MLCINWSVLFYKMYSKSTFLQHNKLLICWIPFNMPMRTLTRTKLRLYLHNSAPLHRRNTVVAHVVVVLVTNNSRHFRTWAEFRASLSTVSKAGFTFYVWHEMPRWPSRVLVKNRCFPAWQNGENRDNAMINPNHIAVAKGEEAWELSDIIKISFLCDVYLK